MRYDRLTAEQAAEALAGGPVALLPLGAVENHGDHLPLSTDNDLAWGVCERLEARLGDDVLVLPSLPYGQVWSTSAFPGTISLTLETTIALLFEIGASLHRQGVGVLAMVNAHMGNPDAMKYAARRLHDELGMRVLTLTYPGIGPVLEEVLESPRWHGTYFHACEMETSMMLALAPAKVDLARARPNRPDRPLDFDVTPTPWDRLSDSPVLGDPQLATAEKGEAIVSAAVDVMAGLIEHARSRGS